MTSIASTGKINMRKKLIIITLVFIGIKPINASYVSTILPELIEKSSVIVYGKIVSHDAVSFRVVAWQSMKGFKRMDTITIQKFRNWTCAVRYTSYEPGQSGGYYPMGAANEGELIVENENGYIPDFNQKLLAVKKVESISKYSSYIELPLKTIISGIVLYLLYKDDISKELGEGAERKVVYRYNSIDKLPKNDFLSVVIALKRRSFQFNPGSCL
jgi:hypothetical protein